MAVVAAVHCSSVRRGALFYCVPGKYLLLNLAGLAATPSLPSDDSTRSLGVSSPEAQVALQSPAGDAGRGGATVLLKAVLSHPRQAAEAPHSGSGDPRKVLVQRGECSNSPVMILVMRTS